MTRTVVAIIALLVLGAAGGIAADRMLHRSPDDRVNALLARVQTDAIGVMHEELNLRPEQREKVAAVLERRQRDINAVWNDTHIRLRATMDSVVEEIAVLLDSSQAARFRTLADEVHGAHFIHRLRH
jgi:hypothetical protein